MGQFCVAIIDSLDLVFPSTLLPYRQVTNIQIGVCRGSFIPAIVMSMDPESLQMYGKYQQLTRWHSIGNKTSSVGITKANNLEVRTAR